MNIKLTMLFAVPALSFLCGLFGNSVPVNVQVGLMDHLLTISSVVIAIIGIWLAVVFPEVINGIYKSSAVTDKRTLYSNAKALLTPFGLAVGVAIVVIVLRVAIEPLRFLQWNISPPLARGCLFGVISGITMLLVISLALAALPGLAMLVSARDTLKSSERRERFLPKQAEEAPPNKES